MKVLHINCNYIWSDLHQLMIRALNEELIDNKVFVPTHVDDTGCITPDEYVTVKRCFAKWMRVLFDYKQTRIINAIKSKYEIEAFDLIHAYTVFSDGNTARNLSRRYKIPYVVAVRNTDINDFFKKRVLLRRRGIRILKEASAIFFLSESYRNALLEKHYISPKAKELIINKSYIIPNGIDFFWLDNKFVTRDHKATEEKIQKKQLSMIYAGKIDANKNVGLTVKAMEKLEEDDWKMTLTVVGKAINKKIYDELKKNEKIIPVPQSPKEKLIQLYRDADVFVMPSHTETFGLVYAEAMSQGLPVIYTKNQGFDKQFEDGLVGYPVSSNDANELAEALRSICNQYKILSQNCVQLVSRFDWSEIAQKYKRIYEKVLGVTN